MGAKLDFVVTLISFFLYLAEMASDIWLMHVYYTGGDWYWFGFTIAVVLVPSLLANGISVYIYHANIASKSQLAIRIIVAILQLSTPFRYGKLFLLFLLI